VDRYRVEFRWIEFPYVEERIVFDQHGFLSLGFENIRWAGDRSDWFIIGSFGVELR